jgi:peptidoglycan/LPS O-acetylase OafA/YrhL
MESWKLKYRKEIDGLRALAIVPVILLHAGFEYLSGGFLGVDIFFVISGYLITTIIITSMTDNKFSIFNFYERRAKRILPALMVVLLSTFIVSLFTMPAYLFKEFSQSVVSVATFSSNVFFFTEFNYFAPRSEQMPLLHTWSLAVEEQFYIFFPIIMFAIWKMKEHLTYIFLALIVCSIGVSEYWLSLDQESASFYLVVSRAWQLLLGSLVAQYLLNNKVEYSLGANFTSLFSLAIIIISFFLFSPSTPHPGVVTLIPMLCTCALIIYGRQGTVVYQFLANKWVVYIGTVSYSLYLWHQPVFALVRVNTIGHPSFVIMGVATLLVLLLSYFSYKYVETPWRQNNNMSQGRVFVYSGCALAFFLILGFGGHFLDGAPQRYKNVVDYNSMKPSPKRNSCEAKGYNYLKPENACRFFEKNISWAVLGDSHSVELAYAFASKIKEKEQGIVHYNFNGCAPALRFVSGRKGCHEWTNETLLVLEKDTSIENVLISYRYSSHLFGNHIYHYPEISSKVTLGILDQSGFTDAQKISVFWQSYDEIIQRIVASGKKVFIVYPIPELPEEIGKITTPLTVFSSGAFGSIDNITSKTFYDERQYEVINHLNTMVDNKSIIKVDTYRLICSDVGCPAAINGTALYFDDNHLSVAGAGVLVDRMFAAYPQFESSFNK